MELQKITDIEMLSQINVFSFAPHAHSLADHDDYKNTTLRMNNFTL